MIPRKKRISILIISILLILFIIVGIIGYLILETNILKSNEVIFAEYFVQNFKFIEMLENTKTSEISNLKSNKYISKTKGNIEYTENIETSDENKNSPINNVGIELKSNIDKTNNDNYNEVIIGNDTEELLKLEYLKQNNMFGIRPNGIKQYVLIDNDEEQKILKELKIENIEYLSSEIDLGTIFNFTIEEKEKLKKEYLEIIQSNVSKEKYYKEQNSIIKIDNKDIKANAYYIKLTVEEYNNLYIKILEQITKDEIILSRIDLIENEIKFINLKYGEDKTLREKFINELNEKIEEIKNNNIGSEEVRIAVYESDGKTIRTAIEKQKNILNIDLYSNSSIKISNIELSEKKYEQIVKIERNDNETQSNVVIEYEKKQDDITINNVQLNYDLTLNNNELSRNIKLEILNEKYRAIFNLINNIQEVAELEDEISLDANNIKLNEYAQEQKAYVIDILNSSIKEQLDNLNAVVNSDEYIKMLQNLNIINRKKIEISNEGKITEIERKRFNSQFEFFVSENLSTENIKDLINVTQNNFEDMKVLLKDGGIEDLDIEKLDSSYRDSSEYIEDISEILIFIKEDSTNENKQKDTLQFIEKNTGNKYDVSIQYDDDGLVRLMRVKIQNKE